MVNTMKTEKEHNEFRTRVVKYLSGEMDIMQQGEFEQLLASDRVKRDLFSSFKKIWDGVETAAEHSRYDLNMEWKQFSAKLDRKEEKPVPKLGRRSFLKIAAAILVGLAGIGGWLTVREYISYQRVSSIQGKELIELEDGSSITLNEGSTLKYSVRQRSNERKVFLTGEAFFEVTRDTLHPFIVVAGDAVIEVLGTSFNIRAYKATETIEVTVQSGIVSMKDKRLTEEKLILKSGNTGLFNRSENRLEFIGRADPNTFAWKTGVLVFSETRLSDVVEVVNRVYGVSLKIDDEAVADCPLTVSFYNQEFSAVLNVILTTFDLQAERRDGNIYLSGSGCE